MATMTRVDSSNQTVYTFTDAAGSTLTLTVTIDPVLGNTFAFSNSGAFHPDGLALFAPFVYPLVTGIVPASQTPTY
jgi:hypothetical protein